MKKIALPVLGVIVFLAFMLTFNFFVSTKAVSTDEDIAKIRIFDGNTGNETIITDEAQIERVVGMLNDIQFKKTGVSIGYIGSGYNITYYNKQEEKAESFIINSDKQLRYEGFFYEPQNKDIDFTMLEELIASK